MKQGGQRFIDQKRDQRVQKTFEAGKGNVEHKQAHKEPVHAGDNGLIHADDRVERQNFSVDGIGQIIVDG